jgi:hypothetical protein
MSKMDDLRAMREARYEQAKARGAQGATQRATPRPTPRSGPVSSTPTPADLAEADAGESLCGHRAISGRTCTREAGHAAKSHRYS